MFCSPTTSTLMMVTTFVVLDGVEVGLIRIGTLVASGKPEPVVETWIVDVIAERSGIRKTFVNL